MLKSSKRHTAPTVSSRVSGHFVSRLCPVSKFPFPNCANCAVLLPHTSHLMLSCVDHARRFARRASCLKRRQGFLAIKVPLGPQSHCRTTVSHKVSHEWRGTEFLCPPGPQEKPAEWHNGTMWGDTVNQTVRTLCHSRVQKVRTHFSLMTLDRPAFHRLIYRYTTHPHCAIVPFH